MHEVHEFVTNAIMSTLVSRDDLLSFVQYHNGERDGSCIYVYQCLHTHHRDC